MPNAVVLFSVTAPLTAVTLTLLLVVPMVLSVIVTVLAPLMLPLTIVTPVNVAGLLPAKKSPWSVPPVTLRLLTSDLAPPNRSVLLLVTVQQLLRTNPLTLPPVRLMLPLVAVTVPVMLELLAEIVSEVARRLILRVLLPTTLLTSVIRPADTVMAVEVDTVSTSPDAVVTLPLQVKVVPERLQLPEQIDGVPLTIVPPVVLKVYVTAQT